MTSKSPSSLCLHPGDLSLLKERVDRTDTTPSPPNYLPAHLMLNNNNSSSAANNNTSSAVKEEDEREAKQQLLPLPPSSASPNGEGLSNQQIPQTGFEKSAEHLN